MKRTFSDRTSGADDGVISCPSPLRHEAILSLSAAHDPKNQSALAQAINLMLERPDADWRGLLIKPNGKKTLSGAIWVEVLSRKEAYLWLPHTGSDAAPELLDAAIGWASQQGLKIIKTVITQDSPATAALLEESGFPNVVTLNYMSATTQAIPNATENHADFVHIKEVAPERLEAIFRQIEHSSMDCSELQGILTPQEALQGFYRQDIHAPEQWYLVRYETEDAGLLLLAPHPEANNWELMYMGLTPGWRGYGLGKQVVNEALRKAKEAGMGEVILAVDQRNIPAHRLYENHGFETRVTCTVHAWLSKQ